MITVGIDLASQPERTGACRLQWTAGRATVLELPTRVSNEEFRALIRAPAEKIGIDVPLGWPTAFVEAVTRHANGQPFGSASVRSPKELTHRATDRALGKAGRGWPLSVSADRIAYPAMRAACLLGDIDGGVDRSGQGRVVEVYPAAALRAWDLPHQKYKGPANRSGLEELLTALLDQAPWLVLTSDRRAQLTENDNCADALIAALVARAAALGLCEPIPAEQMEVAQREGWIAVPQPDSLPWLAAVASADGRAETPLPANADAIPQHPAR